ncbi:hypothetical protein CJ030_MR1G028209 [Morella rubra]|uniref:PGG domain-containing protein n=1 Tax=Morella rubra TaxID=262757 RepID=A0A6A1WP76_9ROSI|nr:hypothetical protein CJ030_MR1G028200 [Morella rubra]KAB1227088.1 hypothetical protein CJ030_MR1G028209 [Morella rubra]
MAFQAGMNPPGGLWQDDPTNGTESHSAAGTAIMADKNHVRVFSRYLASNTIGFVASLSIILLLVTGLPFTRRLFMWILLVIVWVAITAMAYTYSIAILVSTPERDQHDAASVLTKGVVAWCVVMVFLLVGHTIRLLFNMFRKLSYFLLQRRRPNTIAA